MIATQDMISLERESLTITEQCQSLRIVDQLSYDQCVDLRGAVKKYLAWAQELLEPNRERAYAAYQEALRLKKTLMGPAEDYLERINGELARWDEEQRWVEIERRREAERQAERIAEEERLARAVEAETQGADNESVQAILAEPVAVGPVRIESTYQKSSEINTRYDWSGVCTDIFKTIQFVGKHKEYANLLKINQPALNKFAQAQQETMGIPGCRAVRTPVTVSARGK